MKRKLIIGKPLTIPNKTLYIIKPTSFSKYWGPILLTLTTLIFFLVLELKHPYYFLQDDNRDYNLPYFVHNYRSILNGEFPLFNFHHFLGSPSFATGASFAFYPFIYLAVFLSQAFWGNYFASIDIFIIFHLLIAGLGFWYLLKSFGLNDRSSFLGAITWPLSSFIVIISNAWCVVVVAASYLPWIVYFSIKFYRKFSYKNFILLISSRLLLFYFGYVQYFIYSLIFEVLTLSILILLENKSKTHKNNMIPIIKYYFLSYIITFIFSLPLFLPMWYQMTISAARSNPLEWNQFVNITYPLIKWIVDILHPFSEWSDLEHWAYRLKLSHIGYIGLTFAFSSIAWFCKKENIASKKKYLLMSILLGIISLMWSSSEIFNTLIYKIPILNRFRWPFKLTLFTNFYLIILAAIGLHIFFKKLKYNKKFKTNLFVVLILVNLTNFSFIYIFSPPVSFRLHMDKVPLEEPLVDKLKGGRIVSLGFRYDEPYTLNSIGFAYATMWGLYHFAGYDPLISKDNNDACLGLNYHAIYTDTTTIPFDYFRTWGVKWYVVSNKDTKTIDYLNNNSEFTLKYKDVNRTVYYDNKAKPFFFWNSIQKNDGIEYDITTNSIVLNINNKQDDMLTINFLYNPLFKAVVDAKPVDIIKNKDNQMALSVPKGEHKVIIRFTNPYFEVGCYISIAFILLLLLIYLIRRNKNTFRIKNY